MRIELPLTICLLLASGAASAWGGCEFSAERALDLDPGSAERLVLSVGAGELEVRGDPAIGQVQLRGRACASSQELLDQIQFSGRSVDQRVEAEAQIPTLEGGWGSNKAYLDVTVVLPARMQVQLRDSSGDLSVRSVAAVKLSDSSGDINVSDIAGAVEIADSSGDIEVERVAGDVLVSNDSSGDISISEVEGSALVRVDSSGDIEFDGIRKDAEVDRDSSGSIEFANIGGNARVGSDSSGGIRATRVAGDFIVAKDGSGEISHREIGGRVGIPSR